MTFIITASDFDEGWKARIDHRIEADCACCGGDIDHVATDAVDDTTEDFLLEIRHGKGLALHREGAAGPAKDFRHGTAGDATVEGDFQADEAMISTSK